MINVISKITPSSTIKGFTVDGPKGLNAMPEISLFLDSFSHGLRFPYESLILFFYFAQVLNFLKSNFAQVLAKLRVK